MNKRTLITDEDAKEIVRLYVEEGWKLRDIRDKFRISNPRLYEILIDELGEEGYKRIATSRMNCGVGTRNEDPKPQRIFGERPHEQAYLKWLKEGGSKLGYTPDIESYLDYANGHTKRKEDPRRMNTSGAIKLARKALISAVKGACVDLIDGDTPEESSNIQFLLSPHAEMYGIPDISRRGDKGINPKWMAEQIIKDPKGVLERYCIERQRYASEEKEELLNEVL